MVDAKWLKVKTNMKKYGYIKYYSQGTTTETPDETEDFLYADDLAIASQEKDFPKAGENNPSTIQKG